MLIEKKKSHKLKRPSAKLMKMTMTMLLNRSNCFLTLRFNCMTIVRILHVYVPSCNIMRLSNLFFTVVIRDIVAVKHQTVWTRWSKTC